MKENEAALRARRGASRPVRLAGARLEIDPEAHIGVFDYAGLKGYIAAFFDAPVDVMSREELKSYIRPRDGGRALSLLARPAPRCAP